MLTSVHLKNFRGFKDTTVGPLNRVNLIVGQSNTGKTGLLEALVLVLFSPSTNMNDFPSLFRPADANTNENFWKWLTYDKNPKTAVVLTADTIDSFRFGLILSETPLVLQHPPQSQFQCGNLFFHIIRNPVTAIIKTSTFSTRPSIPRQEAIEYNRVVLGRKKKQVESMLQKIEPRLQAIESLQTGNEPLLYADVGLREMIPVTQLGQGFNRLLDIYSEILVADSKVLLIDEIENGLHHSVLSTIWKGLFNAAKEKDVQIFATTHSWECVLAADSAAKEGSTYDLNLIRLDRVEDNIKATIIDKDALETARELEWEMR